MSPGSLVIPCEGTATSARRSRVQRRRGAFLIVLSASLASACNSAPAAHEIAGHAYAREFPGGRAELTFSDESSFVATASRGGMSATFPGRHATVNDTTLLLSLNGAPPDTAYVVDDSLIWYNRLGRRTDREAYARQR